MAEAEKKNISQLDFNIQGALNSLDKIDQKLKTISESSEAYAKKIGQNIGKSINAGTLVDTTQINKNFKEVKKISEKNQQEITVAAEKAKVRSEYRQTEIVLKEEEKRKTAAYKSQLKQQEYNNNVLKSTKTMYDKISNYAQTYLIYQGFNELRQGITETIEEMVDIEYQMVQIDRVLNESSLNIDLYRDRLIKLAYDYGNSFNNVADITLRLAQAGYDSEEAIALTEKTLLALNTAELDATQATEDMVAVMAQWGLMTGTAGEQAKTYGEIIDKINKVADNFPTTSEDILEALKKTSSAFNIAGASINETIAMIVAAETASQRGGKTIGTALSNIVQQFRTEGRLSLAEQMGLDFFTDADKTEFRPIMEIFADMSELMQKLKDEGKENSVEMQNLLEMFTVFRRNIGSSLLGEMAGEDSTYSEVLRTALGAVGYSLQENEKHMKTAKAAQEQFNATLLELKTQVWDGGLEDVFRSMLSLGTNLVEGITTISKNFGSLPTALGAVTLAFTMLSKNMRVANNVMVTGMDGTQKVVRQYNDWVLKIRKVISEIKKQNTYVELSNDGTQKLTVNVGGVAKGIGKKSIEMATATAKTILLEAATIALNTALSMGLSFAITAIVSGITNLINAEEIAQQRMQESIDKSKERAEAYKQENEKIKELLENYEKISSIENPTTEQQSELKVYQQAVTDYLIQQNEYTAEMVGNYDLQLKRIKEIQKANRERTLEEAKTQLEIAKKATEVGFWDGLWSDFWGSERKALSSAGIDFSKYKELTGDDLSYTESGIKDISALYSLDLEKQLEILKDWQEQLKTTGQYGTKAWEFVSERLSEVEAKTKNVTQAQIEYNNQYSENEFENFISNKEIKSLEDYKLALEQINQMTPNEDWTGSTEDFRAVLANLLEKEYPDYVKKIRESTEENITATDVLKDVTTQMSSLQEQYTILTTAQNELNESGQLTVATMQSLIDNDLLSYLTLVDGQLRINTQSVDSLAESYRINAIETLKSQAVQDLENLTLGETENLSNIAKSALAGLKENTTALGTEAVTSTGKIAAFNVKLDNMVQTLAKAAGEDPTTGISAEEYTKKATAVVNAYKNIAKQIGSITLSAATKRTSGSSGSSSAAQRDAERAAEEAAKAAEEAYKARLEAFEDYIDETERLEKRWVDKQEDLRQLTNKDYMYIMQQRIERYKKYIEEVKKATWMAEEDRLKLIKEYSEKIEDYQVDYLGYLEDQLNDEIEALEDATDEKIKLIEEEADARIAALDKVTEATDRLREQEDYESERQSILEEISYWEQRTGREAQEALKEAKEKLAELDKEWEDTQEDWSIEDQIKQIEEERDAQIKSLEEQRDAEIAAMQEVYDAKVKMFAETGKIIYEEGVIQSQALYEAYKNNFIDPIMTDLEKLRSSSTASSTSTTEKQYETYTIQYGDTLSKIAQRFGTTVQKIMDANPYITNKNKIFAGKTLQIPKFHEGGIVGGNQEAFALLKPHEVILKPEWADGINKLAQMARNEQNPITNNSTVIEVKGDLVRIDANIKDKTDAEYLTRRIEKTLKEKFNIKK